jgi:hypothetical protein
VTGVLGACWALATPPYSSIDEPNHVIKSVATAEGQFFGRDLPPDEAPTGTPFDGGWAVYDIPQVYGDAERAAPCYRNPATAGQAASCYSFAGSTDDGEVVNPDPRYPPAFYLFEGLVGRILSPGANAVRLMRLASVAVVSALLASAVASLARVRRPWAAMAGLLTALTPMVFHIGSSVNPNGVEMAAAIAVWAAGAVLINEAAVKVDRRLIIRVTTAGTILVLARPASPIFAFLIGVVLVVLADRPRIRALARAPAVRVGGLIVGAAAVFQVGWYVLAKPRYFGTPLPDTYTNTEIVEFALGKGPALFRQMIGVMGTPDYSVNSLTILLWTFMVGSMLAFGLLLGRNRMRLALGVAVVFTIVGPILFDVWGARQYGFVWQGRYTIPLAVGVPLLAGLAISESSVAGQLSRRAVALVFGSAFVLAQFLAFAELLKRYTVGLDGRLLFFLSPEWSPPVPPALLLIGVLLSLVGLCAAVFTEGASGDELVEQVSVTDPLAMTNR